jgi:hypothetical protein
MIGNIVAAITDGGEAAGDFESISTVTVGSGGAADIEFTSIPSTYQHLQLRGISKNTTTTEGSTLSINGNAIGRRHYLFGDGATATSGTATDGAGIISAPSTGTSNFGALVIDLLDYKDTNKNKTVRVLHGRDNNGSGVVALGSYLYSTNTNAITSIKLASSGTNFAQYSHFALYGIKG